RAGLSLVHACGESLRNVHNRYPGSRALGAVSSAPDDMSAQAAGATDSAGQNRPRQACALVQGFGCLATRGRARAPNCAWTRAASDFEAASEQPGPTGGIPGLPKRIQRRLWSSRKSPELLMSSSELRSLYSHSWCPLEIAATSTSGPVRAIRDTARQRQELKRRAAAAATTTAAAASAAAAAPGGAAVEDLDSISWDDYDEDEPVVPDAAAAGNEDNSAKRGDTIVVRHPASGSSEEGSSGGSGRGAAQQQTPAAQPPVDLHPPAAASASATKILTPDADVDEDLDIDDVELTEEDLKRARELAVGGGGAAADEEDEDLGEDDWGKW
uniref:DUF4614 domain-containing protein n=1 Tax=Macrostomum lignano TaxID=282301 RepID=A0A1I8F7F8_9PLAT